MAIQKKNSQVIINKMKKSQFEAITPVDNELYVITDEDFDAVTDVRVDGTSVVENGIATIDVATLSTSGVVKPDGTTITVDTNGTITAEGVVLQSGGYQKYWEGSKADFDAITTKDENTIYQVLDDIEEVVSEIPTATSTDIGLVKPDNISIVVDDTGTIKVNETPTLYGQGDIRGESGTIKYGDGRMVMWGKATNTGNGVDEVTMHTAFKDANYSIFAQPAELGNFFVACFPYTAQKFKIRIQTSSGSNISVKYMWRAYGYYK